MVSINSNFNSGDTSNLVFIDTNIDDYQTLISGIDNSEIVLLDARSNGIEQITQRLSNYSQLDSIQIISHGESGSLQLGNTFLNENSLDSYADELQQWGHALNTDGDLLFYGCNLAADADGLALVEQVSQLTKADVAASNNVTGHSRLGGDWKLEVQMGVIETEISISAVAQAQYQSIFATTIGESGQLTNVDHLWQTVTLQHTYQDPVVIAGPPTLNGIDPSTVRVRNVNANSFEVRLNEWEYLDQWHTTESLGYVVMEAGIHTLDDGTVITAGTQNQVNHNWETISFDNTFDATPIVLAQTTSENGPFAVAERVRSVSTNNFEIRLQEEEAADDFHADESIGWLAIQPGSGSVGVGAYQSGTIISDHTGNTASFNGQFTTAPVVLASMNTHAGEDPATARLTQVSANGLGLILEEETSGDAETQHFNETFGFLALDEGLIVNNSDSNPDLLKDDRAIAHWSFNQPPVNNQTADVSTLGDNHPGTLINGVVSDNIGGSLDGIVTFDGENDYIAVANAEDLNLTNHAKRTVTAWFRVENKSIFLPNAEDERKQVIYEEGGYGRGLNIYIENGLLYVGGWNESESNWSGTYLSTDRIESNTWHHVALVLDAEPDITTVQPEAFSAYLDGVKFGEGEGSQLWSRFGNIGLGAINLDTQFHDGDVRGTGLELFAGDLADVKVYNRSLSEADIASRVEATAAEIEALNFQPSLAVETIVSELNAPEAIDWIPNTQTMLIVEKAGIIKVLQNGTLLETPFIDISDQVNSDKFTTRGITDIAIHPDFEQNPYVYLFYAYDPPEVYDNLEHPQAGPDQSGVRGARVVRVTADVNNDYTTALPNSEVVLLGKNSTWDNYDGFTGPFGDNSPIRNNPSGVLANGTNLQDFIAVESNFHNTGSLEFGPDGALYVSIGDGTTAVLDTGAFRSQDLDNLSGKVLRVNPITGEGLSDNPFFDGDLDSNRSKVFQYGLRNPFRIAIHPTTGEIFIGETGWNDWEEVNAGGAGVNFGWPYYEGARGVNAPTRLFRDLPRSQAFYANPTPVEVPIVALDHANDGARSVVMGDFYFGDRYPEQYQGDLFFVDASTGIVRNISFDSSGNVSALDVFTTGSNVVSQIVEGSDGYLYFVDLDDGLVGRWTFE